MKKLLILGLILAATATAQQTSSTLEVLRWNCDVPDSIGYSKIYGTVQNLSDKPLEYLKVTAEYFQDKERKVLIAQESRFVKAAKLEPKAQMTFELSVQIPKFAACWLSFETDRGVIPTKYPDYSNSPPPRLP